MTSRTRRAAPPPTAEMERDEQVLALEQRLDRLEARINILFGALGILTVLANGAVAVVVASLVR